MGERLRNGQATASRVLLRAYKRGQYNNLRPYLNPFYTPVGYSYAAPKRRFIVSKAMSVPPAMVNSSYGDRSNYKLKLCGGNVASCDLQVQGEPRAYSLTPVGQTPLPDGGPPCMLCVPVVRHTSRDSEEEPKATRLGHCRVLEEAEDKMGVGRDLMSELRGMLQATELPANKESVYSLISMAMNSKFLFDGNNMIRVKPQESLRQLFGENPSLFARIRNFVQDRGAMATAAHEAHVALDSREEMYAAHRMIV